MASKNLRNPPGWDEDEIITALVKDASDVPDVRMLIGFRGKSSRKGYCRLYLTPELSEYVEIPQDEIHHWQQLDKERFPLGGVAVWVNREADLLYTRTTAREVQADFLQGDITSTYLKGKGLPFPPPGRPGFNLFYGESPGCNTSTTICVGCMNTACTCPTPCYPLGRC